jgi:histidyl-tRNA synthetase
MSVDRCKGTRDLSPVEMAQFRSIEGVFRDSCLQWGYQEVRTPTLEYLHLFTSAGTLTPARLGKVYSFLDWDGWSGERVVLRPDGTIPIARYYIEAIGSGTAKLFYVNNIFSFEETGTKNREIWQCGAELIGAGSPMADVELVVMAIETLKRLGIADIELRLSHAGLIRAILGKIGSGEDEQHRLFDLFLDGDTGALLGAKPELERVIAPMLETKGRSAGFLRNVSVMVAHAVPELEKPLADFINVAEMLDKLGKAYEIDVMSGRGFEYYTGALFQIWSGGESVAGGGRYDALIPLLGGKETPASGFALSMDRLMGHVRAVGGGRADRVIVRPEEGDDTFKDAYGVLLLLHDAGFAAEIVPSRQPISPGERWLLEIKGAGWHFSLRDLNNGNQYEMATAGEVVERLKKP